MASRRGHGSAKQGYLSTPAFHPYGHSNDQARQGFGTLSGGIIPPPHLAWAELSYITRHPSIPKSNRVGYVTLTISTGVSHLLLLSDRQLTEC